jgi:spermidine/putrescine transport system permease protein
MKKNYGPVYSLPLGLWITIFFIVPTCIIFIYSFLTKATYGGVQWQFSLEGYKALANTSFINVVWITVYISVISTFLTVLFAIPTAYYIARNKHKNQLLLLVIIPFWTNFLIRVYAWIAILGNNGFVNNILVKLGVIDTYVQFLYNQYAVILVIIYTYLPYAILPLYSSIEKFDFSLLEAARDLGATKAQAFFKVLLPNIKGGLTTSILFTFIPALGSYVIPMLVGGKDSMMLGNIISRELTTTRNWPLASSISVVLTVITMIGVLVFLKLNKNNLESVKKLVVREKAGEESV